jgi:hypothetical protein
MPVDQRRVFCIEHAPPRRVRGAVLYVPPWAEEMNKSRRMAALQSRALAAVIEITAAMYTPGVVERHSDRDRSWFAVGAPTPAAAQHVETAAAILRHAGVVEVTDDIRSA